MNAACLPACLTIQKFLHNHTLWHPPPSPMGGVTGERGGGFTGCGVGGLFISPRARTTSAMPIKAQETFISSLSGGICAEAWHARIQIYIGTCTHANILAHGRTLIFWHIHAWKYILGHARMQIYVGTCTQANTVWHMHACNILANADELNAQLIT